MSEEQRESSVNRPDVYKGETIDRVEVQGYGAAKKISLYLKNGVVLFFDSEISLGPNGIHPLIKEENGRWFAKEV